MRTTLSIDDDVLTAARQLAEREHKSLGEVISNLARQGLTRLPRSVPLLRNGVPLLPRKKGGTAATADLVKRLHDEQA